LTSAELAARLAVIVIVERRLAEPRSVVEIVRAALHGGAMAFQLRNKGDTARDLLEVARELRPMTREVGALLFVNDRLDVAIAAEADGVHLGPDDMPVAAARAAAPRGFLIGRSADDPNVARMRAKSTKGRLTPITPRASRVSATCANVAPDGTTISTGAPGAPRHPANEERITSDAPSRSVLLIEPRPCGPATTAE